MDLNKERMLELLQQYAGRSISYESISPSVLSYFEIRGLKIGNSGGTGYLAEIGRARLSYNIFRYRKEDPLAAFSGLTVLDTEIVYDIESDGVLADFLNVNGEGRSGTGPGGASFSLPGNFFLRGRNLEIYFKSGNTDADIRNLFFEIRKAGGGDLEVSLRMDASAQIVSGSSQLAFAAGLSAAGRISTDFTRADLNLKMRQFESDYFSADKLDLNLRYGGGEISLVKTGDRIPLDISAVWKYTQGLLALELVAEDFVPDRYYSPGRFVPLEEEYFSNSLSGRLKAAYSFGDKSLEYEGDLSVKADHTPLDFPLLLRAVFSGENENAVVHSSGISSRYFKAGYAGGLTLGGRYPGLAGRLDFSGVELNGTELAGALRVSGEGDTYRIKSGKAVYGGLSAEDINAKIGVYDNSIEVKVAFRTAGDSPAVIEAEGLVQPGRSLAYQAEARINGLAITEAATAAGIGPLPELFAGMTADAEIYLAGEDGRFSYASPGVRLESERIRDFLLEFGFSGNNERLGIDNIRFEAAGQTAEGRIAADFVENGGVSFNAVLEYGGIPYSMTGASDRNGNLAVSGNYGLSLSVIKSRNNNLAASLALSGFPLPFGEDRMFISLDALAAYKNPGEWKVLVGRAGLDGLPFTAYEPSVGFSALISPDELKLYSLEYRDGISVLKGGGSAGYGLADGRREAEAVLYLKGEGGREDYSLRLGLYDEELQGNVYLRGFPVKRLAPERELEGTLELSAGIGGTLKSPQALVIAETRNGFIDGIKASVSADLGYSGNRIIVNSIAASYGGAELELDSGTLDLNKGSHTFSGRFSSAETVFPVDAVFSGWAETRVIGSPSEAAVLLTSDYSAGLQMERFSAFGKERELWEAGIERVEGVSSFRGGPQDSVYGSLTENGRFTVYTRKPFPVKMDLSGYIGDGKIDARMSGLEMVLKDADVPKFHIYEGKITGDVNIRGNLNDPDFYGQINLVDIVLRGPIVTEVSGKVNTSLFLSQKTYNMPSTRVVMENGAVLVSIEGKLERWLPVYYDIGLNIPDRQSVAAEYYKSPFYAGGFVSGKMRLYGDMVTMYIDGSLKMSNGTMMINSSMDAPQLDSITEYSVSNLTITTGENNQFLWPTTDFPIVKAFLSPDQQLKMLFDTSDDSAVIDGEIALKGGEIFYFERNFYLKEGAIIFENTGAGGIDPLLDARAEIRDVNPDGDMVKIFLIVDRAPLSSFTPRFESEPSLSTNEIVALLGGNILDSIGGTQGGFDIKNAVLLSTDLFTQFWLLKGVEENMKKTLGLDLLSIRSSFLSNIIEDKLVQGGSSNPVDNFAKYLDNTTLFVGKYFTDDIFLQGLFQFDLYNESGYSSGLNMNLDSEIKLEWEGPVANLQFSFYPDFNDPVKGLSETSVGLSWHFSF